MEELRDIQGLDHISMWPLAIGWWVLIILALIALICGAVFAYKRYRFRKSWQYKSYIILDQIQQQLGSYKELKATPGKQLVHQLAIEIRRIAMQKYARESCAGLLGREWLTWLQAHDPLNFAWTENGQVLIDGQYQPSMQAIDANKLTDIVNAAKGWVNKC